MIIKKLYLDPFMDMFNSEIINYSISKQPSAQGVMKALNEAIDITNVPTAGLSITIGVGLTR